MLSIVRVELLGNIKPQGTGIHSSSLGTQVPAGFAITHSKFLRAYCQLNNGNGLLLITLQDTLAALSSTTTTASNLSFSVGLTAFKQGC